MSDAASRVLARSGADVPDGAVVVALSGGPDSAVAAWLCCAVNPARKVSAVFVDHQWPGSAAMGSAAAAIATRLEIPLGVVEVPPTNSETAAREVRLEALVAAAGDTLIVTGHHADDAAETVLLNLLRGAGTTGLSGIPRRRLPFVRPLLDCSRTELRTAALELGLPFHDDPANADPKHLRNRLRNEVLPVLDEVVAGVVPRIAATASLLAADDAELQEIAARVPLSSEPGAVRIPMGALVTQPAPIASRIVRRALRSLRPPYAGSATDVAKVLGSVYGPATELTGGLRSMREGPFVVVLDPALATPQPSPRPLAVDEVHEFGPCVVSLAKRPPGRPTIRSPHRLALDASLEPALLIRRAEPGERIAIVGGSKLVRDAMAEAGVPPRVRSGWPVIDVHGRIAAVAGVRVAAWATPGDVRQRVLELITERSSC